MNQHININNDTFLPDKFAVLSWYEQLAESLKESNQRLIISLQGNRDWCLSMLPPQNVFSESCVLSNSKDLDEQFERLIVPFDKAETLLGQEVKSVLYDGFCGLNIDVMCMASGLVQAGGILILLTPSNPQGISDAYGQWQGRENSRHYFFNYLHNELRLSMLTLNQQQLTVLPECGSLPFSTPARFIQGLTRQQMRVNQQLNSWLNLKEKPVFFLTADRGRGKSTLLGYFAQQHWENINIVVSSASKAQVKIMFQQIDENYQNIRFLAPDEIIRRNEFIDLLIIDEAAMLPGNMLHQCLALAHKAVLATTTGGYEGTGQGFLVKFMAGLHSEKYIHQQLTEAVRWGQQDKVESWVNKVLMLKPELSQRQIKVTEVSVHQISKAKLNEDRQKLREIYELLVSAHYRTRPSDLRQLMEDENQLVIVAQSGLMITGVLLLNMEGGLSPELSHEVFMGRRRPQGHLFAQMITAQAGVKSFACLQGLRVQRIAVNQNCRMQGVGRSLIKFAESLVIEQNFNYLCASFALDSSMAPFWSKTGFKLVHISSGKGKSTGRQTVAVLKSTEKQVVDIISLLQTKINNYLPVWLLSYCQSMSWIDVYALLDLLNYKGQFTKLDEHEIVAFGEGYRGFDLTQATLQKLLISELNNTKLDLPLVKLCIEKILLNKKWAEVVAIRETRPGKKEQLKQIRKCIALMNEQRH